MTAAEDQNEGVRLAEEIRLLIDMVVERAGPWLDGLLASGHGSGTGAEHGPARPRGCDWCPLCAVVAIARGERPELAARLAEQAAQLVALLRAVLADRWEPQEGVHMPGFSPSPRPEPEPEGGPEVQRVTVRPRDSWDRH
ncbi:hypothetical protein BAY61_10700 [Prauserella marina]|uniref:Uncharacterized protein n=1 Tax=Prauserella marina TaxID=530584 RepID=A0A222VNA1_9PSEU|nr:hypothetical protein [Prauserella marina]ASR35388.1 hypothetical protein BAY61_10700 [Prauserella marina]PWV84812.1 hypothetical protein DES30_101830 [Prauserella marina]SDC12513.1 hypothetical protein SAMN05421630_101506 [Prauserella marina]